MAKRTYDLEFVAIFRREVEADSEDEAQAILDAASIEEVYQNDDWNIDPFEFQKQIRDSWGDDEDDSKESA